jgi:hypothetical protein
MTAGIGIDGAGWQIVGEVAIDSGTIALIDPQNDALLEDYWTGIGSGLIEPASVHRLSTEAGVLVGLIVRTGFGDGVYPVEARFTDEGDLGRRVAEIRIQFIESEPGDADASGA